MEIVYLLMCIVYGNHPIFWCLDSEREWRLCGVIIGMSSLTGVSNPFALGLFIDNLIQGHHFYRSSQLLLLQPCVFILIQSRTSVTLANTDGIPTGSHIYSVFRNNLIAQLYLPFSTLISGPPESPGQAVPGSVFVRFPYTHIWTLQYVRFFH